MAALLIGHLTQKYMSLVNDSSLERTPQIIKIGGRKEAVEITKEYCDIMISYMDQLADLCWNKNDGNYLKPEFQITSEWGTIVLGPAVLGLIED